MYPILVLTDDYIVAYLPVGTAFIPYYELITQDVGFDKERYVTIGRKHLTGSALRRVRPLRNTDSRT